jgi:hypothetical protein
MLGTRTTSLYGTLVALAAICAQAWAAPVTHPATATRPKVRPVVLDPLEKAGFRRPDPEVMAMIYSKLREQPGLDDAQIATVPVKYVQEGGTVVPVGAQFATFFGDVDGDGRGDWVVGFYVSVKDPSPSRPFNLDDRARIAVFRQAREGGWTVWCSPGLGWEFAPPDYNVEEVLNGLDDLRNLMLPLSLVDVDNDGRREIAYHCRSQSAALGGLPGVYRLDGARWVSIAPQADRFSLQDVDGDHKLEVVTGSRRIGQGAGDDDVPRVWRWRDRQYREASSEFPRFYSDLAVRYHDYMKRKEQAGETFDRAVWERAIQKATLLSGRPAAGSSASRRQPI